MQVPAENITKLIVFSTLFFVILAFFITAYVRLYNQRKKKDLEERQRMKDEFENQLLRSQIEVQETTNAELGRELHDNVGQLLSTASMLLGITERKMTGLPDTFVTAQETLTRAIGELRTLSKSLDKEWLSQFNCIDNIRSLASRINASGEIRVHLDHPDKLPFDADQQVILFRVIQEAVQNSLKHAQAKNIDIKVGETADLLFVKVSDDGNGMPPAIQNGMGLLNMNKRARLLGGSVNWQPAGSCGTIVSIEIPINNHV